MNELYEWLWSDTSFGDLLGELAYFMNNSEDKEVKAIAYGVARQNLLYPYSKNLQTEYTQAIKSILSYNI